MSINLIATTTFGLEAVVKRECQALGFQNIKTSDGKVEFTGDESDIVKANLWLRCAPLPPLPLRSYSTGRRHCHGEIGFRRTGNSPLWGNP